MDYVYEEDLITVVSALKKEQNSIDVERLLQLCKQLEKKVEEMDMVWKTEQASVEMKELKKLLERINNNELYKLVKSIQEINVGYDFNMMQKMNEG